MSDFYSDRNQFGCGLGQIARLNAEQERTLGAILVERYVDRAVKRLFSIVVTPFGRNSERKMTGAMMAG